MLRFTKFPTGEPPAALDAFYVTRLQKERMSGKEAGAADYVRFDARALRTSKTHEAVVMHPLPRTSELAYELDADPRAVYFEQAAAGSAGPHGVNCMADGKSRRRIRIYAAISSADSLQGRSAAAMRQSELHHAIRGRPSGSTIYPRAQQ